MCVRKKKPLYKMIGVKAMTDEGKVVFRNNVFIAPACGFHVSGYRGGV